MSQRAEKEMKGEGEFPQTNGGTEKGKILQRDEKERGRGVLGKGLIHNFRVFSFISKLAENELVLKFCIFEYFYNFLMKICVKNY